MELNVMNHRNFIQCKNDVFKKAFKLQKWFRADVTMIIELGGEWFIYYSIDSVF